MAFLNKYSIGRCVEIRDPVFSYISVPNDFKEILDHRIFQRLRWVGQLPLEQLVYPSAQHSRFEHSIGTMHLAMFTANSLLKNAEDRLRIAFKQDSAFSKLKGIQQEKEFLLAAGLVGLLHDLGHAPFSHTFEEACQHSSVKFKYCHEKMGFHLSKALLSEVYKSGYPTFATTALKVLNKELKFENVACSPIDKLLRKIVDGPIDVDKGDYIFRDSYHCGTIYGSYDVKQLWQHVTVTDDYELGVDKKGAIEAWTLRIARYKMHHNVYKHHVRNITDALLIEIISRALSDKKFTKRGICPFSSDAFCDKELGNFVYWTDSNLIRNLFGIDGRIDQLIESFMKRNIYKRGDCFPLSEYPNLQTRENRDELIKDLGRIKKDYESKGVFFNFQINSYEVPPVFSACVQSDIKVVDDSSGVSVTLADHLGFNSIGKIPNEKAKQILELFISESDVGSYRDALKADVEGSLKKYRISVAEKVNRKV